MGRQKFGKERTPPRRQLCLKHRLALSSAPGHRQVQETSRAGAPEDSLPTRLRGSFGARGEGRTCEEIQYSLKSGTMHGGEAMVMQ